MPDDPRAIADSLTKASKRALPHLGADWRFADSPPVVFNGTYSLGWGKNAHLGLIEKRWSPGGTFEARLTPLGLQVRAILQEEASRS